MSNRFLINAGLLLVGIAAVFILSKSGCNSDTKEVVSHTEQIEDPHYHAEPVDLSAAKDLDFPASEYDKEIDEALGAIAKGKETSDMTLVMQNGIMKILAVSRKDSNNVRANYHLALFAIESGQLEKAEKRFEKLILLQPENQEYQKMLDEVRKQQGK